MPKTYGNIEIWGDLLVTGTFSIIGSASSINVTNLVVSDTIIAVGTSQSGSPVLDEGLLFSRGSGMTQGFIWDESDDKFALIQTDSDESVIADINIIGYSDLKLNKLEANSINISGGQQDYILISDSLGNAYWTASIPGTSGTSGVNGTTGISGTSGTSGENGDTGESGTSGSSGTSGNTGTSGTTATFNYMGDYDPITTYNLNDVVLYNGSSYISIINSNSGFNPEVDPEWSLLAAGGSLISGTSGTRGTSGISGTNGTSGTGTSGISGTNGTSGSSGTSGESGTSGSSGTSGENGTSGTSGESGTAGTSGENGTSGTSGESGTSGTSGESGTSGTSGESGTSGTSGESGTSGTSGESGTSGTSGESGTSGTSGASGTSGTSGESGTAGTSGESGTAGTSGESGTAGTAGTSGSTTSIFMVNGTFVNMFGGDPGGTSKDILEWGTAASAAANHSSILTIPVNCKIISAGFKWISSATCVIGAGSTWSAQVFKINNPATDSTTADGNFTFVGDLNISLSNSDNGTTPGKFSSGLNITLNAGDIIRIAGVESGPAIATSTDESEMTIVFQIV